MSALNDDLLGINLGLSDYLLENGGSLTFDMYLIKFNEQDFQLHKTPLAIYQTEINIK